MEDKEFETFLEHHGVKGQQWGIRNKKTLARIGRVGLGTTRLVGRGAKGSIKFIRRHPVGASSVLAGSIFIASVLNSNGSKPIQVFNDGSESFRSTAASGSSFIRSAPIPWSGPVSEDTFAKGLRSIRTISDM